jgi:hypothetical protein
VDENSKTIKKDESMSPPYRNVESYCTKEELDLQCLECPMDKSPQTKSFQLSSLNPDGNFPTGGMN